ncbi:MAG: peptide deformylase [Deltaproteobacteria bacterium RIFOXYD12_FULL_50_9]|nr:MAG: peptide deformylase [Deltaproteobacteria bacterium RIFOXYD12_FULL_50_9]
MALREILTYPDPELRKQAEPVTVFDDALCKLVADMAETMANAPGVGLAATQIGVHLQVVVIDITPKDRANKLIVLINPAITAFEGEEVEEEGCLSVIELCANVKRWRKVWVRAQDLDGKKLEFEAEELFARVIQHEFDHLQGKLFLDRISPLKRALYKKKLRKILQEKQDKIEEAQQ